MRASCMKLRDRMVYAGSKKDGQAIEKCQRSVPGAEMARYKIRRRSEVGCGSRIDLQQS